MTETEVAWLAGLLEGEGCFRFRRGVGGRRGGLGVELQMIDKDVVVRAHFLVNSAKTKVYTDYRDGCKSKGLPIYRFGLSGKEAERVMLAVRPYMGERRGTKIDELLAMTNLSHHPKEKK